MTFYEQINELKDLMKNVEELIKKQELEQKRHMQNGYIEELVKLVRPITEYLDSDEKRKTLGKETQYGIKKELLRNEEILVSIIGILKKQQESIEKLKGKLN
jgi:hypothetical protein